MNVGGLIKYIEYLPVLKKVENSFSEYITSVKTETNQIIYPSDRAVTATSRLLGDTSTGTCIQCKKEFTYTGFRKHKKYCSKECSKRKVLDDNKNPFSIYGTGDRSWSPKLPDESKVMGECYVDPAILEQAILYTDCATDIENGGYACAIYEDMAELDRIMMYELGMKPTHYEKRHNAKWSGRNYQSVKAARNYRRKQLGLPKIPSIKTSNLDKQLAETNERRRGLRPKLKFSKKELQYRAEEAGITGFATITPMTTKSGKSITEILDDVQRKKSMGTN